MLALPNEHWERLVQSLGLIEAGTILDVGCGSGAWLCALAQSNTGVVGVDVDRDVLAIARERSSNRRNVEVLEMAAETLQFGDGSFDVVTCFTVLPYLDQTAAVTEMARVLRSGGTLLLGTVGSGYYAKHVVEGAAQGDFDAIRYGLDPLLVAAARTFGGDRVASSSVRSWSPRAVRRLVERHGLSVDRVVLDVAAVNPDWPTSFLGRPFYSITFATKRST